MSLRARRIVEEHDNPAWPGLVDLFAFGMVIVLLLWAQAASETAKGGAKSGDSKPTDTQRIELRLNEIVKILSPTLGSNVESVKYEQNPQRVEIRTHVRFPTQEYQLLSNQRERVASVVAHLMQFLGNSEDTLLVISGKADPRPFQSPQPPRDNIELSALRAAEVMRLVFLNGEITAALEQRFSVRGLGDQGEPVKGLADDPSYERFRTVTFEIHVDKSKLARAADQTPEAKP